MSTHPWWQTTVIYQIYPRSFQDTTGNGIGDLPGITSRIDYLADTLGVGALWISPFYPSPMADFGYDVSNYIGVHPMFGDIKQFDALMEKAHSKGLKVIIDWVPNHTSDEHPWFGESRYSRDSLKRDWYIWRDPKPDGSPPNNWVSFFGGPAWEFDEATGQYYLHSFLAKQPDLNWRNPEVHGAMFGALRYWLDRGVDGFRIDVAHVIMKDPDLRDNPPVPDDWEQKFKDHGEYDRFLHIHDKGHEDNHALFRYLRSLLDGYQPERYSVGEIHIPDWEEWASYYGGEELNELHQPFNFSLVHSPWNAEDIASRVAAQEEHIPPGAWPNYVLGNHDEKRITHRLGEEAARTAAMMLLTLRGTPTLYYGDEIGMLEADIAPADQQDPWGRNLPGAGRDGCRTPMQWDEDFHAGFSEAEATWLPVGDDYIERNVAHQLDDPDSMLNLYRALITYRKESPSLLTGNYRRADAPDGVFAYRRNDDILVALNMTNRPIEVELAGDIALSTHGEGASTKLLRPHEGLILEI